MIAMNPIQKRLSALLAVLAVASTVIFTAYQVGVYNNNLRDFRNGISVRVKAVQGAVDHLEIAGPGSEILTNCMSIQRNATVRKLGAFTTNWEFSEVIRRCSELSLYIAGSLRVDENLKKNVFTDSSINEISREMKLLDVAKDNLIEKKYSSLQPFNNLRSFYFVCFMIVAFLLARRLY